MRERWSGDISRAEKVRQGCEVKRLLIHPCAVDWNGTRRRSSAVVGDEGYECLDALHSHGIE